MGNAVTCYPFLVRGCVEVSDTPQERSLVVVHAFGINLKKTNTVNKDDVQTHSGNDDSQFDSMPDSTAGYFYLSGVVCLVFQNQSYFEALG